MKVSETLRGEGPYPGERPSETRPCERRRPRKSWLALAALVPLALSGCKTIHHLANEDSCNKPQPYQRATSIPPLNVPAGLDAPDTSHALDVPKLNEPDPPPRRPSDPCLAAPPSFNVPHPNTTPEA